MPEGPRQSLGALAKRLFRRRERKRSRRDRLAGVLQQVKALGFAPATVVDVGAAYGDFSLECQRAFPSARYVLIEALEEYTSGLEPALAALPGALLVNAAAASAAGEIEINVHADLVGSSLYLEQEDSAVNGVPRKVRAVTLDSLKTEHALRGPFLVKIDVQGAELDVLAGAEAMLAESELVLLEVSFFEFFRGGPQFHEVVAFMQARGFVAYDLFGFQYRPLDGALSQADVAFVRESGPFRRHHFYATREQREQQDRSLKRQHRDRGGPRPG